MATPAMALLALGDVRDTAAAALAPVADTDPDVFADVVEAVVPPALLIEWDDPWLEAGAGLPTMGPCLYTARLRVVLVAGRLEPGPGYDMLDELVIYVLSRMRSDSTQWTLDQVTAPLQRDLAGVTYLAANVNYTVPTHV
jgi:hypothetical protein